MRSLSVTGPPWVSSVVEGLPRRCAKSIPRLSANIAKAVMVVGGEVEGG